MRRSAVAGSGKLRTAAVGGDQLRLQQLTVAAQRLAELGNDWQGLAANVDSWQRRPVIGSQLLAAVWSARSALVAAVSAGN